MPREQGVDAVAAHAAKFPTQTAIKPTSRPSSFQEQARILPSKQSSDADFGEEPRKKSLNGESMQRKMNFVAAGTP